MDKMFFNLETDLSIDQRTVPIVINSCHGKFSISDIAKQRINALRKAQKQPILSIDQMKQFEYNDKCRSYPLLVKVVHELGTNVNGDYAELIIYDLPLVAFKYGYWKITAYNGKEIVDLNHAAIDLVEKIEEKDRRIAELELLLSNR